MGEPWFWRSRSLAARAARSALIPAALVYQASQRLRWSFTSPYRAEIPVICIGNATLGGVGKTPFAILVSTMLREQGVKAHFLTRGYGGALAGPVLTDPDRHDADDVGDEALLLARHGPAIVSRDRPAGAKLAAQIGAQAIIMDDGFQNPTLAKDFSILLTGAGDEDSNGALFPAGPYREAIESAKARADLVVSIGAEKAGADYNAWLEPHDAPPPQRVIAFAGIGRPEKFFDTLSGAGFDVAGRIGFPDHHRFSAAELSVLTKQAARENARLICTEKDFMRLPEVIRADVLTLPVAMRINDPDGLKQRLMSVIN